MSLKLAASFLVTLANPCVGKCAQRVGGKTTLRVLPWINANRPRRSRHGRPACRRDLL